MTWHSVATFKRLKTVTDNRALASHTSAHSAKSLAGSRAEAGGVLKDRGHHMHDHILGEIQQRQRVSSMSDARVSLRCDGP